MRSRRPYLLRAMYEWMADAGQTPYILVDARQDGVQVPQESVHEGRVVLNVSGHAANRLALGNEQVEFDARFNGISHHVVVPIRAVLAIYARETGQGMMFGLEDDTAVEQPETAPLGAMPSPDQPQEKPARTGRPTLKVVK